MKELYISPELELICFVAEEKLASGVDFGGIGGGVEGGEVGGPDTPFAPGDFSDDGGNIELPEFPGSRLIDDRRSR